MLVPPGAFGHLVFAGTTSRTHWIPPTIDPEVVQPDRVSCTQEAHNTVWKAVCLWGLPTLTCGHSRVTGAGVGERQAQENSLDLRKSDPKPTTYQIITKCLLSVGYCAGAEDTRSHSRVTALLSQSLHSRVSGKR